MYEIHFIIKCTYTVWIVVYLELFALFLPFSSVLHIDVLVSYKTNEHFYRHTHHPRVFSSLRFLLTDLRGNTPIRKVLMKVS